MARPHDPSQAFRIGHADSANATSGPWEVLYLGLELVEGLVWSLRPNDRRIDFVNAAAREMLGTEVHQSWPDDCVSFADPAAWQRCWQGTQDQVALQARWELPTGKVLGLELRCRHLVNAGETRLLVVGQRVDTAEPQSDAVTGLASRASLDARLKRAWDAFQHEGRGFALLFVDLDNFKEVNDQLGHIAGDQVLRLAAARLASCVRVGDSIARYGGDEFVLLLDGVLDRDVAHKVAERIRAAMAEPVVVGSHARVLGASVGIALAAEAESVEALLQSADRDMFRHKSGSAKPGALPEGEHPGRQQA